MSSFKLDATIHLYMKNALPFCDNDIYMSSMNGANDINRIFSSAIKSGNLLNCVCKHRTHNI